MASNKKSKKAKRFTTAAVAGVAAAGMFAVALPAFADNITANTWYIGSFSGTGNPVYGGGPNYAMGTSGPILPSGTANPVVAPSGTSWTITMSGNGFLTVTDYQGIGDYFTVYDNGNPMALHDSPLGGATGRIVGGLSETSAPGSESNYTTNISDALAYGSGFSSGTFALLPGVNTITMLYDGTLFEGDMAFIADPNVPEPGSLAMFGTGLTLLGGLGLFLKRRRHRIAG